MDFEKEKADRPDTEKRTSMPETGREEFIRGAVFGAMGSVGLMLLLLLILVWNGVLGVSKIRAVGYADLESEILDKVHTLESYISTYFLDDIDNEKMADAVYKGVVNGLGDKYAAYYPEKEYKQIQEKNQGSYCGIGVYIAMDDETGLVKVLKPFRDSPFVKAGGKEGDLIYKVDGKDMTGKEISEVQSFVKGEKGSKVEMTLIREKKQVNITVIRDEIKEETVAYRMLPGEIGYVQVAGFDGVTVEQFGNAVDDLEKQGQKAMIIDLRNNGGGLLDSAVKMLDKLLPKGLVVYSQEKTGKKYEFFAQEDDEFTKPLVILVNENSASASEVFAGAMQDKGTGVLMGTQTFGKGIVQTIFELEDKSALKLTTAKYYTPLGRNIHGKGLTPDVKVELSEKLETLSDGKTEVDSQLKKAWEYLKKQE